MRHRFSLLLFAAFCSAEAREIPVNAIVLPIAADAEILIDPWGIAHIYAKNDDDLFFLQGWNAARDRLWQIDTWRRRGLGQMSEVFGNRYLDQDRAARLFLYRGDLEREWQSYGPDAKRFATRFVEGINAYIAEALRIDRSETAEFKARRREYRLPPEFRLLNYRPAVWSADDIVRIRAHGLSGNAVNEADRARFVCRFGVDAEVKRRPPSPETKLIIPTGLDPCAIPADVLSVFDLATREMTFADVPTAGSNNWAVGPKRTRSGRPVLASDPHRALTLPSLRYAVHLQSPTMNVIGAGEPFLPGISIGHNGTAAFGLTRFYIDQEDLYVYVTKPGEPNLYRYAGKWEAMRVVREKVADQEVELKFTRHGPVVREDPVNRRAYALRAAWLDAGTLPYFGSMQTMRARDWPGFKAGLRHWGSPGLNHVYADEGGNIGWQAWGRAPVRKNWDGLFPVPGDGRYEWQGYYGLEDLPSELNPERGWIATANQMNLPPAFQQKNLGFEWVPPWRQQAIERELALNEPHSVPRSVEIQTSYYSPLSVRLVRWFAETRERNATLNAAAELLASFEGHLGAESAAAALYVVWKRELWRLVGDQLLPLGGREGFASPSDVAVMREMEAMSVEARDAIFLAALARSDEDLLKALGPTRSGWSLGQLQRTRFEHPLVKTSKEIARVTGQVMHEYPRGGDTSTINVTSVRDGIHRSGASWRMVIDVGAWDDSVAVNAPGQSGDPMSLHFADLYGRWAADQMFPLLYSRERVEAVAEQRITIKSR